MSWPVVTHAGSLRGVGLHAEPSQDSGVGWGGGSKG